MVAGLETITAGDISIGGRVVNELEPRERDIAMVFQNYALYPHMSVRKNLAYGLKIAKVPSSEINRRVEKAAKMLQLDEYLERKPRQLSGGQRQRVAMGRAIVREPAAFLFDEPLSNLDAKLRVQMRMEIKTLQRELGVTSLYVTHDQVEAMTMADRVVVMNAGVAEQIGPPLEVYHNPASLFVAGFIGSPPMNFITPALLPSAATEGATTLGIRPEHVALTSAGALSGNVAFCEALGADTLVHIRMADDSVLIARTEGSPMETGTTVGLDLDYGKLVRFDADGRVMTTPG
jgi:sn-glycerol 3-phosphate transport system ATP-binding protein